MVAELVPFSEEPSSKARSIDGLLDSNQQSDIESEISRFRADGQDLSGIPFRPRGFSESDV